MSSTYSTNLAIELIGTGDQAGNWGSTTNTNLGTLLEQAISGYVSQAIAGSDVTLAMTNGASATARNMFIQLTGSGNGNLIVPANKKLYFIYNTASTAVTVKVTGLTGVSVPVNAKVALVCDGTDIVTATNYMTGATFPSPTLTGTPVAPTASFGTNTTQVATTAFVQAALQALHPVGSIYTSTSATNPGTSFGFGTWVAFGSGRVLIGDGGGYTAGDTGGSADAIVVTHNHTATVTDPGHAHNYQYVSFPLGTSYVGYATDPVPSYSSQPTTTSTTGITVANTSAGADGTNKNLQPYVVVYMWNRTA